MVTRWPGLHDGSALNGVLFQDVSDQATSDRRSADRGDAIDDELDALLTTIELEGWRVLRGRRLSPGLVDGAARILDGFAWIRAARDEPRPKRVAWPAPMGGEETANPA